MMSTDGELLLFWCVCVLGVATGRWLMLQWVTSYAHRDNTNLTWGVNKEGCVLHPSSISLSDTALSFSPPTLLSTNVHHPDPSPNPHSVLC